MENYRMNYRNNSCRRGGCAGHTGNQQMEPGDSCSYRTSQGYSSASGRDNAGSGYQSNSYREKEASSRGCNSSRESEVSSRGCNSSREGEASSCGCNSSKESRASAYDQINWGDLPIAMAYVPAQKKCETYSPAKGLRMGTIFPVLCKPFCGKGGGCH